MKEMLATLIVLGWIVVLSPAPGTASEPSRRPSTFAGMGIEELDGSSHTDLIAAFDRIDDPLRPVNEISLGFTRTALDWIIVPAAEAYQFVPGAVRRSLDRFSYNATFPDRVVSLLLQGELRKSGEETAHFLTNTTIGALGLLDPASDLGVATYAEDVGQAFGRWGVGPGFYVFIPLAGPSSARDVVGRAFDLVLNPFFWAPVPGLGAFFSFNAFSLYVDEYQALVDTVPELYVPARALWSLQREIAVSNFTIPEQSYATADPEPSLEVLRTAPRDPDFVARAAEHTVRVPSTGRELPYSVWMQDAPAPLVFLVPGIGAHRTTPLAAAVAEAVFRAGSSVVAVSSPFHEEFIRNALSTPYPGYTPHDSEDLYAVLSAIRDDVAARCPTCVTAYALLGYSLGGIETLFLAAAQPRRAGDALRFARFVALNSPVDLLAAGRRFDRYFRAPARWPSEDRAERTRLLAKKVYVVATEGVPPGRPLPFDRSESQFLIGFNARLTLAAALAALDARRPDQPAATDIAEPSMPAIMLSASFARYLEELVFPSLAADGASVDELAAAAGLRSQARALRRQDEVRVITNANDFLLDADDLAWLRATFGERLTLFEDGGHLGNLGDPRFQAAIVAALAAPRQDAHPAGLIRSAGGLHRGGNAVQAEKQPVAQGPLFIGGRVAVAPQELDLQ